MAQKRFNALNWFRRFTNNRKMNKKNSNPLMGFLLEWSVLENLYFSNENRLSVRGLFELGQAANEHASPSGYTRFINHFKERYFGENPNGTQLFEELVLNLEYKELVRNVVRDSLPLQDIISSLLLIANRFRNNFMHGRKEFRKLHLYEKQFNILNQFLAKFIEETGMLRRY